MKFLCVKCDEPMKLDEHRPAGPGLARGRLPLPRVLLRDRDADQPLRDPGGQSSLGGEDR